MFENTPAWKDGILNAGDELIAVNGRSLKGMSKVQAAKFIQRIDVSTSLSYKLMLCKLYFNNINYIKVEVVEECFFIKYL